MSDPFMPLGATVTLAVTASTGNVALTDPGRFVSRYQVRILNTGSERAYIAFGGSTITATTASMPIPAGNTEVFTIPGGATYMAAICDTALTTTLYATCGFGE
jgi:hypothetical protein